MIGYKKGYFLNHQKIISEVFNRIQAELQKTLTANDDFRTSQHSRYEELLGRTKFFMIVPEKMEAGELIDFYSKSLNAMNIYKTLAREIPDTNIELLTDLLFSLENILPSLSDYKTVLLIGGDLKESKAGGLTASKKLLGALNKKNTITYQIIAHFKLRSVAAKLREEISAFPIRKKNYAILFYIQRFGLLPVTNFEKIKPEPGATIIKLDYENPVVYNFANLKKTRPNLEGVSQEYISEVLQPIQLKCPATPASLTLKARGPIYETFDGVHFRKLYGNAALLERGPSGIAHGYGRQFNAAIAQKKKTPFASPDILSHIKGQNKIKFDSIISALEREKKENMIPLIREHYHRALDFVGVPKILQREISLGVEMEMRRFAKILDRGNEARFIEFLRSEKSNLIFKVEQKIKIYEYYNRELLV